MKSVMETNPMFFPGRELTIQTPQRKLTLIIDKPFAPFTKAVVLLARSQELGPDPVVVKIYDPRFLDERLVDLPGCPPRPWSLELERAADAIWDEPFDRLDLWDDWGEDTKSQATLATLWEKHFRILSTGCFESETEIYDRLRPLQGSTIPRLLATGTFLPPDERVIQPPAIIIEYIPDAVSLADVPVDVVTPELCATLLQTVDSFGSYGVVHMDVHWNNVLFTPAERPTRVVIIDFGCGGVRDEGESDEDWKQCVLMSGDSSGARWALKKRGISVPHQQTCRINDQEWSVSNWMEMFRLDGKGITVYGERASSVASNDHLCRRGWQMPTISASMAGHKLPYLLGSITSTGHTPRTVLSMLVMFVGGSGQCFAEVAGLMAKLY